jgi:HK97 family phage prohead protease
MRQPLPRVKLDSHVVKRASGVVRLDNTMADKHATKRSVVVRLGASPVDKIAAALRDAAQPMRRAHATLTIKRVDEDHGLVTGVASTPSTDLVGDIMEPSGAVFRLPLPFLLGHNTAQPLGHVVAAQVTDKGIAITAKVATQVDVPFIRDAWALLKAGLIRGLSVGFRGLDVVPIKGTAGLHYKRWALLEISAVTIPANGDAQIETVRACDCLFTAADFSALPLSDEVRAIVKARAELRRLVR